MPVSLTSWLVEAEFAGAGGGWTAITNDVQFPARARYGIFGGGPLDRVAGTGTFSFDLDNSTTNSGGLLGYYSPDHVNVRSGFAVGIAIRLSLTYGGTTYYKFRGTLDSIVPETGQYRSRRTHCTVVDWMDEAALQKLRGVATQTSQRSDQLFSTILANVTRQPAATSVGTGADTYAYALDNTRGEGIPLLEEFQRLAMNEAGFIYQKGDTAQGGTLVFESRTDRAGKVTNSSTFSDSMVGLSLRRTRSNVFNRVQAVWHPRVVDAAATTVLFSITNANDVITLGAGETRTIQAPYTDPALRGSRVGGTSMVSPVATTDYQFFANSDGTGADLTSSLTVTATFGGDQAVLVLTNTHAAQTGFVTKLQLRGKGIYDYQRAVAERRDATSATNYGERLLTYDMAYQSDPDVADGAASYFLNAYATPTTYAQTITLFANSDNATMTAALAREPGDRIGIQETVSGLTTTTGYLINAVDLELLPAKQVYVTWTLTPSSRMAFWLLGTTGASELGTTTTLGF